MIEVPRVPEVLGATALVTRRGRSLSFDATWRPDELLARAGVEGERRG